MGDLIRPTKVHVISKEGEVQLNITIDLNINLNTGNVDFKVNKPVESKVEKEKEEDEKTIWAIPNFGSKDKVKFGKKKEQE